MRASPWGNLPVSDSHIHFFSQRFVASLAGQKGIAPEAVAPLLGWQMPAEDPAVLADVWGRELDRHGIEQAVFMASHPADADSAIAAARRFPGRFHAFAMVNPVEADAPSAVEAALSTGHLRGLCFFPAMHRYSIQDDRASALLDLAARAPAVVAFVHCGVLSVGVRRKLGLPSLFDMRFSNPIDLHAVALRYPQLRFIVPHFGAGYFREAMMLCDLCPNVYLDTSSSNSWVRYEETGLDLRAVFRRALDVAGPRRLLFGTDSSFFPRGWNLPVFEAQSTALYEIGVTAETARLVFHENLQNLFS